MNTHINTNEFNMNDQAHLTPHAKTVFSWIAAALGIGSVADFVPIFVGVLSAGWLVTQIYGYFKYDLPLKKVKLEAARKGLLIDAVTGEVL